MFTSGLSFLPSLGLLLSKRLIRSVILGDLSASGGDVPSSILGRPRGKVLQLGFWCLYGEGEGGRSVGFGGTVGLGLFWLVLAYSLLPILEELSLCVCLSCSTSRSVLVEMGFQRGRMRGHGTLLPCLMEIKAPRVWAPAGSFKCWASPI